MKIGEQIKSFRLNKGYSVNRLANEAGLSQSYLRDVELCKKNPTVETLSYICDALEISLADFFNEYCRQEPSVSSLVEAIYRLTPTQRQLLEAFLHSILTPESPKEIHKRQDIL